MKIKLGILFGGRTVEHEISVITANQAITSLDKEKYEIIPIYISKKGLMYTSEKLFDLETYKDMEKIEKESTQVILVNDGTQVKLEKYPMSKLKNNTINTIDIAFPIMHGTNGEDGTLQGYLEMLQIPYVGPDVLGSSIGMDKIVMKKVMKESGLPVVDYYSFYTNEYIENQEEIIKQIEEKLEYPVIVKPGNLGSSVGIRKADSKEKLSQAIEFASQFTDRILVEKAVVNLREINCSVLGDMTQNQASVCEEPIAKDEILSYEDKYVSGGKTKTGGQKGMASLDRKLPAEISKEKTEEIQKLAKETFKVLGCVGVSRIDFLMDAETEKVYVNEINTIPGALSFYLWETTGKPFTQELDEIIQLALQRQRQREKTIYSNEQNIFALGGIKFGTKGKLKK